MITGLKTVKGWLDGTEYAVFEAKLPWSDPEPRRNGELPPVFFRDNYVGVVRDWTKGATDLWLKVQMGKAEAYWRQIEQLIKAGKLSASPILLEQLRQWGGVNLSDGKSAPIVMSHSAVAALYSGNGLKFSQHVDGAEGAYYYKTVHARCASPELQWIVQRAAADCAAERQLGAIKVAFFQLEDQDDAEERASYQKAGLDVPWKSYTSQHNDLCGFVWPDDPTRIYIHAGLDPENEEQVRRVVSHEVYHASEFKQWGEVVKSWPKSKWEADAQSYSDSYIDAWRKGERWATKYAEC